MRVFIFWCLVYLGFPFKGFVASFPHSVVALTTAFGGAEFGVSLARTGTIRAPAAGPGARACPGKDSSPAGLGTTGPSRPACPQVIHS